MAGNDDLASRIAALSPAKRALFEARLQKNSTGIGRRADSSRAPLSSGQEAMYFLHAASGASPAFNRPVAMGLSGPLNADAMERAINSVVARHEGLRACVTETADGPQMAVSPAVRVALERLDARPGESPEKCLRRNARLPMSPARVPLLRAGLLCIAPDEHVLLLTFHHMVFDGLSEPVLFDELAALYESEARGTTPDLPDLPVQFGDFAAWERRRSSAGGYDLDLAYWRGQLTPAPEPLGLPADRRRSRRSYAGDTVVAGLPPDLSANMRDLARREGATPFIVLLAAFKALLARYTGRTDLHVGAPSAGRNRLEVERLIGYFVNPLVLRTDLAGDPTFREAVARVRRTALGAYEHQETPLGDVVKGLGTERGSGGSPPFQILFHLEPAPPAPRTVAGVHMRLAAVDTASAIFDLSVEGTEADGGFRFRFIYDADIFDRASIELLAEHYGVLLAGAAADPDLRLSELPLMSEQERHRMLVEWNASDRPYTLHRTIHELVEEQVRRTPHAPAVVTPTVEWSYAELNARANRLAALLRERGVRPGDRVAVCMQRSAELVAAVLAALKAGAAYVPMDPAYPQERLGLMAGDAEPAALVTDGPPGAWAAATPAIIDLRIDADEVASRCPDDGEPAGGPESAVYVMYTSGSTGRPKGVAISHKGLVNYVVGCAERFGTAPGDRWLQFATICFDMSAVDIFASLISGATIMMRLESTPGSAQSFLQQSAEWGISILHLPTAYWHALAAEMEEEKLSFPPQVRLLVTGGESAIGRHIATLRRAASPGARIINEYGPTEVSVAPTWYEIPKVLPDDFAERPVPIGIPVPNARLYVLDEAGALVPIGVPGELYVGGAGVGIGYVNRPEATAERFLPDPFSGAPGARMYRTGDIVRWLPSGNLEFRRRMDTQVKVRGFRVEPGEIEAALVRHPGVREAAVFAEDAQSGEKRLVGCVTVGAPSAVTPAGLRAFLAESLPAYMVPARIVILDSLPTGASGKIDHRAVPARVAALPEEPRRANVPCTATQEEVAGLWRDLLGIDAVGADEDFFALGGSSLQVMTLLSRIRRRFGVEIEAAAALENLTVAGLSALISPDEAQGHVATPCGADGWDEDWPCVVPVQTAGSRPPLFMVSLGLTWEVRDLSRHLGAEQPVYRLRPSRLLSRKGREADAEDVAAHYVREMRQARPSGPYIVAGGCAAGVVAFEVARQLVAAGQEVPVLALFDAPFPAGQLLPYRAGIFALRLQRTLAHVLRLPAREQFAYFRGRARFWAGRALRRLKPGAPDEEAMADDYADELRGYLAQLSEPARRAVWRYRARPYAGRVALFLTRETGFGLPRERRLDWRNVVRGGFQVHQIPGEHHHAMEEPHVRVVAEKLGACIEAALNDS